MNNKKIKYWCDYCNKTFFKKQNYDNHMESTLHEKIKSKCDKYTHQKTCDNCNVSFKNHPHCYYNHYERNKFLDGKIWNFDYMDKYYTMKCNHFTETQGNKDSKRLTTIDAEAILHSYKFYTKACGTKVVGVKNKYINSMIGEGESIDTNLTQDELDSLENIEDELNDNDKLKWEEKLWIGYGRVLFSGIKHFIRNQTYELFYDNINIELMGYIWIDYTGNKVKRRI